MAGLYIHIPFCKSRCAYCAFYSTVLTGKKEMYADALARELHSSADFFSHDPLQTIYIGGGTPSILGIDLLGKLDSAIKRELNVGALTEFTVECNPDDITPEFADGLRQLGVNRVSMGIQSFDDALLKALGRRHNACGAMQAVHALQQAGFSNISIDLMYGLPGQTLQGFSNDIDIATGLGVQHISAYCLSYEEGTRLWKMREQEKVAEISDDDCAAMFNLLCSKLKSAGYEHYEISNFCMQGYQSKHNSCYWNGTRYLGLGAGAHSYDGNVRFWNMPDIERYIESDGAEASCREQEVLTETDARNEAVMLSLRTAAGLDLEKFKKQFGIKASERLMNDAEMWIEKKDLILEGNKLHFNESSLFISDSILSDLFLEQDSQF